MNSCWTGCMLAATWYLVAAHTAAVSCEARMRQQQHFSARVVHNEAPTYLESDAGTLERPWANPNPPTRFHSQMP